MFSEKVENGLGTWDVTAGGGDWGWAFVVVVMVRERSERERRRIFAGFRCAIARFLVVVVVNLGKDWSVEVG